MLSEVGKVEDGKLRIETTIAIKERA